MTPSEARDVVKFLMAGYPTQRTFMSATDIDGMLAFYVAGLVDLDAAPTRAAIIRLSRSAKKIPTVAEIRAEVVGVLARGARRTGLEAWGEVLAAVSKYGSHRWPGIDFQWGDPVVARVVAALNWSDICASEATTMVATRARFIDAYEAIAKAERTEAQASNGARNAQLQRAELAPAPARHELEQRREPDEPEDMGRLLKLVMEEGFEKASETLKRGGG